MDNSGWRVITSQSRGNEMSLATISPAEVKDAEGIVHVHVTAWQHTYRGLMPDSVLKTLSVERKARYWKETLREDANLYPPTLVAEIDSDWRYTSNGKGLWLGGHTCIDGDERPELKFTCRDNDRLWLTRKRNESNWERDA